MSKKVFTSQKLSIHLAGEEHQVQALVSSFGAKYVFDDSDLPPAGRALLGSDISVSYKGIPAHCRFVREINPAGTIYSLRFLNPSTLLLRQIARDVETSGLPSPWMRGLPRLSTSARHLPMPVLAVLSHANSVHYLNVRNFTLGGLLLEYSGDGFDELPLGTRVSFDLVTNGGDKLADLSGAVTHISVELGESGPDSGRYQFGLRFEGMSNATAFRYRELIRSHCEGLKGGGPAPTAGAG